MLRFVPILLAIIYAYAFWRLSAWRTVKDLNARSSELMDPALRDVTARLAKALDLPKVRVFLYENPVVNGLAGPDGQIYITRGFLSKMHAGEVTPEEMASVIAHELGHVALGHSRRRMIDFSGQNAIRTALAMILGRFLPGLGMIIANGLMSLLAAKLSRSDEYEADAYATALLIKAGIGSGPQVSLFRKLDTLTGAGGKGQIAWMLSHPVTDDRIAAIEANALKWKPR